MHVRDDVIALALDGHGFLAAVGHGARRAIGPQEQLLRVPRQLRSRAEDERSDKDWQSHDIPPER